MKQLCFIAFLSALTTTISAQPAVHPAESFLKDCPKWNGMSSGRLQGLAPSRNDSTSNLCFVGYYARAVPYEIIFVYKASVTKRKALGDKAISDDFFKGCSNLFANFDAYAFVLKMKDPDSVDPNLLPYEFPTPVTVYKRIKDDQWQFVRKLTVNSYKAYRELQFRTIYNL